MKVSDIDVKITRSKRSKTISVFVERDGSVSARVPQNLEDSAIKELLKANEYSIQKKMAEWTQANEAKILREYVNGQSFLYLGKNYRLQFVDEEFNSLKLKSGYFVLSKTHKTKAKDLFVDFYKKQLREKLPNIVNRNASKMGVKPNDVKVMDLQNRWASCTPARNINFHWKCAMAPIDVLNYIVVHELAHLIHPNHTNAFWNEVDKVMPNYEEHHTWLKINGAKMDL